MSASFSSDVKKEIMQLSMKKTCCRKSFAYGLLLGAYLSDGISISFTDEETADEVQPVIRGIFGREPQKRFKKRGNIRFCHLTFESKAAEHFLSEIREKHINPIEEQLNQCPTCRASFLRGIFVSCGTVTNPDNGIHLELRMNDASRAAVAFGELLNAGFSPKIVNRKNFIGIYLKKGEEIENFISYLGANQSVFVLINSTIKREIRNNENRATNCVTSNIKKSVSASTKQFEAIEKIIDRGLFETMPEELRVTASLRYNNLDISMNELAALHDPPISKSGLNHRLDRIIRFSETLK